MQEWAGLIDVTPDVVPVISPVDEVPGLVIATGFSGHGFGIGPGAGRLVADIVMGTEPDRRPDAVPLLPLHRRIEAPADLGDLICGRR